MKTPRSLLEAASDVFAQKGYQDATIAEICKRAGANIAAVNYHFGSKKALYVATWRHCVAESMKAHPMDGGVRDDAPPEERLRGHVEAILSWAADESNRVIWIEQKESANPTGLLHEVMRRELRPRQERLLIVVRELLGPRVPEVRVWFCGLSLISQCFDPMVARRVHGRMPAGKDAPPGIGDIKAYSDHVVKFCLAGMRAIREDAEGKRRAAKNRRGSKDVSKRE